MYGGEYDTGRPANTKGGASADMAVPDLALAGSAIEPLMQKNLLGPKYAGTSKHQNIHAAVHSICA